MFEYKIKSIINTGNKVSITISINYLENVAIEFDDQRKYKRWPRNLLITSVFNYYPVSNEQINQRVGDIVNYFAGVDPKYNQNINL